jgi:hypothetical protein
MYTNECMILDDDELDAATRPPPKADHFRGWRVGANPATGNTVAAALNPSDFPPAFHNNKGGSHKPFEPRGVWRRGFTAGPRPSAAAAAAPVDGHDCMGALIAAVRDSFRISPDVASIVENGIKLLPLKDEDELARPGDSYRPHTPSAVCGGELARPHTPTYEDGSPYDPIAEAAVALGRKAAAEAAEIARVIEKQRY